MISLRIGNCDVDILPIVKGLVSEAEPVRKAYGKYEAYAVTLGIEEITAISQRERLMDDHELSEIDMVYAVKLSEFGEVESPTPAFCEVIDLCSKDKKNVIPLDMNNNDFTTVYLENVKTMEFVKEHRLAKKGMKRRFDMSSAENFAIDWDRYLGGVKGYAKINRMREKYIADQIADICRYRSSLLAVVEVERLNNIVSLLKKRTDGKMPEMR